MSVFLSLFEVDIACLQKYFVAIVIIGRVRRWSQQLHYVDLFANFRGTQRVNPNVVERSRRKLA